jgi:phosphoribosylanthranilate isomerase
MILKSCGITCQEDASAAMAGGANAVGFNFYARSRFEGAHRAAMREHPMRAYGPAAALRKLVAS